MKKNNHKSKLAVLAIFILIIPLACLFWIKIYRPKKTKAQTQNNHFLSPLAQKSSSDGKAGPLPDEKIYRIDYYLSLSDSYLKKATKMANNNPQQTQTDRLKIITALNNALKAVNQAIKYYPDKPEGYLTRAKIWQNTQHIWPELADKVEQDLQTAQKLINSGAGSDRLFSSG